MAQAVLERTRVLRSAQGRSGIIALVLVAEFAQIARNWLMLQAVGVEASVFDATAALIAIVTLCQLPVGPASAPRRSC